MTKTETTDYLRLEFEDTADVKAYLDTTTPPDSHSHTYGSDHGHDFCPFSYQESEAAFMTGWPAGSKDISIVADGISSIMADADSINIDYDVTGQYLDIGRYMTGEPETFGSVIMTPQPQEEIAIAVSTTVVWNVPHEQITNRGAAITALIDELQKTHFVKLQFRGDCTGLPKTFTYIINVDTRNTYSRDLVAFLAAHPGMARRIGFAIKEAAFNKKSLTRYRYGYVIKGSKTNDWDTPPAGTIFFESLTRDMAAGQFRDIATATRTIQGVINKIRAEV